MPALRALCATVLIASQILLPVPARAQLQTLPGLGDGGEMTASAERNLGDQIARELYRDTDYIDDPVIAAYVQEIWQRLLAAARQRGELTPELDERFAWTILLGRDRNVNAFALPGGYLGLNMGLIATVGSRDELATVLGHELSHVTQRHISRIMSRQGKQMPWMLAGLILGMIAASKSRNADAGQAVIMGSQALFMQNQLSFSRDMEREADRVGFGVMTQAGFAPQGAAAMFEKLQYASRLNDNGSYPYLRSHPLTTERISDMQGRFQFRLDAAPPLPLAMDHAMIAARARVLTRPGVDVLRLGVEAASSGEFARSSPAQQAGTLYAAALSAKDLRDFKAARALAERLTARTAEDQSAAKLARWLTDARNPLTARVMANRVWQWHFGRGLAGNANNLGATGKKPTHPELLDWLARTFVERGWSMKAMHRLIATSATYRQSSRASAELLAKDPQNLLLARGPARRLSAEMLRDQALAVSGLLVEKVGGPSVKPYQPAGLLEEIAMGRPSYGQGKGADLYRRSLYTFWKRTVPPPAMMTLDAADRSYCTVKRQSTSTPLLAQALLNHDEALMRR